MHRSDDTRASNIRRSIACDQSEGPEFMGVPEFTAPHSEFTAPHGSIHITPAKPGKGKKGCPQCQKHVGSAARTCSRCNHIFVPKSTAKKMHAAAKRTPEVTVDLQSSPTPLFRLSAQQRASVLEQPANELSVGGAFGHRLLGGRVDYLVQWSGGGYDGHTSWVKATNATNCNALIASYWATGSNDLTQTSIAAQDQNCGDEDLRASCSAMGLVLFRLGV